MRASRLSVFKADAASRSARRLGRVAWLALAMLVLSATGCRTHLSLRDNTVRTADTLTDLNYQQVLDNLARFHDNPGAMRRLPS